MRRWPVLATALALSAALHVTVAGLARESDPAAQIAGRSSVAVAALGNSFEDLAAGSVAASSAQIAEPVERPVEAPAEPAEGERMVATERPAAAARAEAPEDSPAPPPPAATEARDAAAAPPTEIAEAAPEVVQTVEAPAQIAETPASDAERPAEPDPQPPTPQATHARTAEAARPEDFATPADVARLEAIDEPGNAPEVSQRPRPRGETRVTEQPSPPAGTRSQEGNAERDARRGQQDGAEETRSTARASSGGARTAEVGNAGIDNWRGQVLRKLQRQRRPRIGSRGTAMVQFSIAPSGAVTSVSVSRSSGSQRVDNAAAEHVRRASPFPPPPGGRAVALVVAFESRG